MPQTQNSPASPANWRGCQLAARNADFWHAAHDFAIVTVCGRPLDGMTEDRTSPRMTMCPACARTLAGRNAS